MAHYIKIFKITKDYLASKKDPRELLSAVVQAEGPSHFSLARILSAGAALLRAALPKTLLRSNTGSTQLRSCSGTLHGDHGSLGGESG